MRCTVYKALDRPSSFLGLKGSYLTYTAILGGVGIVVGIFVGTLTIGLVGLVVALLLFAAAYACVMAFQARYSEKQKDHLIASYRLPDFIVMPPHRLSKFVTGGAKKNKLQGKHQ